MAIKKLQGLDAIRRWVVKTFLKEKEQTGVMVNLPKKDFVDLNTSITAERLMRNGIDPNSIKSEDQVENIINQLNKPKVVSQGDPEFEGIMSKMLGSNVVKADFGKPFKEEIKKMKSDEEIVSNIKKSNERSVQNLRMQMMDDKVANDMFQGGPSRDPKTDADMLAEFIAEDAGKIYDDLPTKERLKFYDRAYNAIMRYKRRDPEDMADGGRIGYFLGSPGNIKKGQSLLRALLNYFGKETGKAKPSDFLRLTNPKSFNKLFEEAQGKMSKEGIMGTDMVKDYQTQMRGERIKSIKDMLESGKNIKRSQDRIKSYKNEVKQKFIDDLGLSEEEAEVAATRLSTLAENIVSKEGSRKLPNITEEGILQLENIIKNMETGGKKARDLNADGGRIGFKKGMDRRTFMKMVGGLTALPILGKLFKGAEVAAPVVEKAVDVASGAPPYFFNLVDRIRALGTKYAGPKERSESYLYKDYEMDIDLDTGKIDIKKTKEAMIPGGDEAGISEEVYMTYKPGMADETTKGGKVVDEYEEFTARPDIDGKMKDVEDGVPDEVIEEGSISKEELEQEIIDQIARDKKASGGIAMMLGE